MLKQVRSVFTRHYCIVNAGSSPPKQSTVSETGMPHTNLQHNLPLLVSKNKFPA